MLPYSENSPRTRAECAPSSGTAPSPRAPSLNIAGGAAIATFPFGVSTTTRRNAGWRANSATPFTSPYAVFAARSRAAAAARVSPANTPAICPSTADRFATRWEMLDGRPLLPAGESC